MAPAFPDRDTILRVAFCYPVEDDAPLSKLSVDSQVQGFMTKDQFLEVVAWKAVRQKSNAAKNGEAAIERATRAAFAPFANATLLGPDDPIGPRSPARSDVEASVRTLSELRGVGTRMASAILTVFQPDLFTVLHWRAWSALERYGLVRAVGRSIDLDQPATYVDYLAVCIGLAGERSVSLRNLDRCLFILGGAGCDAAAFLENRKEEGLDPGY